MKRFLIKAFSGSILYNDNRWYHEGWAMGFVARDWFSWDDWDWNSPGTKISGTAKSQAFEQLGTLVPRDQKF